MTKPGAESENSPHRPMRTRPLRNVTTERTHAVQQGPSRTLAPPTTFTVSIGGHTGPSYRVELDGDALLYASWEGGYSEQRHDERLVTDRERWAALRAARTRTSGRGDPSTSIIRLPAERAGPWRSLGATSASNHTE